MAIKEEFTKYAEECQGELIELIKEISVIPAPSHHEERRAEFVKNWMEKNGAEGVFIDDALNVIWPYNVTDDNDVIVFMGHTDIVFPEETPLNVTEKDGRLYCPGIGDDVARLAALLMAAKYFMQNGYESNYGILFIANSCEEGLGNLKGSRMIVDTYGERIKNFITYDGILGGIVTNAVGSHRYKITVKTCGGHSWNAFGNPNAIAIMSDVIAELKKVEIPKNGENSRTTYNFGGISGGTSVNTIAPSCEMLYEYRSNDIVCINKMKEFFDGVIASFKEKDIDISVELLGERPCKGDVDEKAHKELIEKVIASYKEAGYDSKLVSGSTDANYPLFKGIPAVCAGTCIAGGAHTVDEWVDIKSLYPGMCFILDFMAKFFK